MKLDGTIVDVGAADRDTDRPKSKDLIYVLRSSFQEMARTDQCKAVAIVFDVTITLPKSRRMSDAIQMSVEHVFGYSVEVFFPYQTIESDSPHPGVHGSHGGDRSADWWRAGRERNQSAAGRSHHRSQRSAIGLQAAKIRRLLVPMAYRD